MKFTNIKQLIIKFMGGGIINFPTRFLRWVKIDGDVEDSDDGGGGGSSSMSMYDIWMKAFNEFKVYQDNNDTNVLNVVPALYTLRAENYSSKRSDTPIPLTFMNSQTYKYNEYNEQSYPNIFDIKDVPDDIYEQSLNYGSSYIKVLYDLDELNEKAHDINSAIESISIPHRTYIENSVQVVKGNASYVPESGIFKYKDKFYVWFPSSMD